MKKSYDSPEFDYVQIKIATTLCASAENVVSDIFEEDDGDDL